MNDECADVRMRILFWILEQRAWIQFSRMH